MPSVGEAVALRRVEEALAGERDEVGDGLRGGRAVELDPDVALRERDVAGPGAVLGERRVRHARRRSRRERWT